MQINVRKKMLLIKKGTQLSTPSIKEFIKNKIKYVYKIKH